MLTAEQIIGIVIGGLIILLFLFMTVRTLLCKPPKVIKGEINLVEVDSDGAAKRLSEAVSIATVTPKYPLEAQPESVHKTFFDFHAFLERSYPLVFARAEKTIIHKLSLVLKIDGSDSSLLPACFLGHMDVVPAPADGWETDPFGGEIKDGYVYGRGSQDMKCQVLASIEGLEILLKDGFIPKRTIYYCFGHDEELTGKEGAEQIVTYLKENNIRMEYVIDEGGTLLDGASLGISGKVALIGTCEKGYADFLLTAQKDGGHGSSPKKNSAVDTLADAILDLKAIPMRAYWSGPVKQMFAHLAPELKGIFKFIMVNRDILAPLLKLLLTKVHPITNALLRTTFSFTQLVGSDAPNVIPRKASVNVNCRINIGQTKEEAKAHIQKVVGKNIIVTEPFENYNPSPISDPNSEVFKTLSNTIRHVFEGYIPAPYPFMAASDAKYYYEVSDNVYRFTPFLVSPDDQERIHAINERCKIEDLSKAIQFFAQYIIKTC